MAIKISGNTVIDDSQNISVSGNATANSFVGDGSNLTNLPGGGNVTEATASGTLADGSKVIVNSDGTVSVVALSETTGGGAGDPIVYDSNLATSAAGAVYDSANQRVVVMYYNADLGGGNATGRAVVGTVSGTSISFGSPYTFYSGSVIDFSLTYDSTNQKVVAFYRNFDNSNYGTCIVGTVNPSNNTISFGSPVVFKSTATYGISATYDSTNQKVVVAYKDGSQYRGHVRVGTVSGTSISFGSEVTFSSGYNSLNYISATYDSTNGKVVIAYEDNANNQYGTAIVGTVSGTSISFGTPAVFESAEVDFVTATFDSTNNKVVIAYRDRGNSDYGTAVVGTVSGTSISFGSPTVFESGSVQYNSAAFDSSSGKVVITYDHAGNSHYGTAVVGTVSGTSISFETPFVFESGAISYNSATFDSSSGKVVVAYTDVSNTQKATSVVISTTGQSIPQLGSASIFESATTNELSIVYDSSNDRMVMAYRDDGNSGHGTAVVGTVSGTSITFGTPVVFNSGSTYYTSMAFDSTNNKVVISYADYGAGGAGKAIVGTVSGTSISFGTEATITGSNINYSSTVYDPDSEGGKILVFYRNADSSGYGMGQIGTVSGTSISFASPVTFESASVNGVDAVYTTGGKTVIVYQDDGNSDYGTAVVATINPSGGALTFGTPVVFHSGAIGNQAARITYDSDNDKVVIIHNIQESGSYTDAYAVVGTVSGTLSSATISFGTSVVFETLDAAYGNSDIVYDSDSQKIVIAYRYQSSPENGKIVVGSVSGTSISFESSLFFREGATVNGPPVVGYDSTNKKVVVAYRDIGNSSYGTAKVFSPITKATNLTTENYIGISDGAFTNGQTATIQLIGSVDDAQSSLTPGQKYYIQNDGTLSETASDPSVFAGTAVSSTSLVVKS